MRDVIDQLLSRADIDNADPASRVDIQAVMDDYNAAVPELLLTLWCECDGVLLERLDAHLIGPSELLRIIEENEWDHAARLLDASNLAEWARLLDTDHFVRRDVRARMQKTSSPAIRELLRKDAVAFDAFAMLSAEAAEKTGLKVGRRDDSSLQVGKSWIELEAFFHRRGIPNAVPRMIAWFQDVVARRDPNERPGHFMQD